MKKFLLSLATVLCAGAFASAEDILWSEDFSTYTANAVPTGGTYDYKCVGNGTKIYNEKLAGGTAPELLVGKNGGSFTATIPMDGKSGAMTLSYQANYDRLTVTVTGATLGEKSVSGNAYTYPVTVTSGTQNITIEFKNSTKSNARLDNIKLFQGTAKSPAGLSWGTASRIVTIGDENNNFPTLTNPNNLSVTYSSDNTEVATIDAEGVITLVSAGEANITATFAGNDKFEAGEVTYKLTVKAGSTVDISNTYETAYTVAKAYELIEAGEGLDKAVYVKGYITNIQEISTEFGNATYSINDNTTYDAATALVIYRGFYGNDGGTNINFTTGDEIAVDDVVVVYGKLKNYNGSKQMSSGNYIVTLNGGTTGVEGIEIDENAPVEYFNLQGVRVENPANGLYIMRQGDKVVKVIK